MIPYFFMEVECIGNTQIIHMEETGMTQRTIGLRTRTRTRTREHETHLCVGSNFCQKSLESMIAVQHDFFNKIGPISILTQVKWSLSALAVAQNYPQGSIINGEKKNCWNLMILSNRRILNGWRQGLVSSDIKKGKTFLGSNHHILDFKSTNEMVSYITP